MAMEAPVEQAAQLVYLAALLPRPVVLLLMTAVPEQASAVVAKGIPDVMAQAAH